MTEDIQQVVYMNISDAQKQDYETMKCMENVKSSIFTTFAAMLGFH